MSRPQILRRSKSEVPEIKKMVADLYNRLIIAESVVTKVVPEVNIENIWAILDSIEEPQERRKKTKHQSSAKKDTIKKVKTDSL